MRILVTNDDGINAPGLDVCAEIARALSDDVWVVAPEFDQSGVSHSLSLNDPLRMRAVEERRFAIKGTPTDCVIMGVRHILDGRAPDLILSGVNRGQNAAEDVTYSGTIAGALESTILGIPAFALSQAYSAANRQNPFWDTALTHGPGIIRKVLDRGIPRDVLVNVNFPDCAADEVKGVAVTTQGKRDQEWLRIDARQDGRGNPYYWIAFSRGPRPPSRNGTDLRALSDHWISVTPLRIDMTDEPFMTRLAELFG
jgi:5'-nucleotidase